MRGSSTVNVASYSPPSSDFTTSYSKIIGILGGGRGYVWFVCFEAFSLTEKGSGFSRVKISTIHTSRTTSLDDLDRLQFKRRAIAVVRKSVRLLAESYFDKAAGVQRNLFSDRCPFAVHNGNRRVRRPLEFHLVHTLRDFLPGLRLADRTTRVLYFALAPFKEFRASSFKLFDNCLIHNAGEVQVAKFARLEDSLVAFKTTRCLGDDGFRHPQKK